MPLVPNMVSIAELYAELSVNHAWWYQLQEWFGLEGHPDLLQEYYVHSVVTTGVGKAQWRFQLETLPYLQISTPAQGKNNKIDYFAPIFQLHPRDGYAAAPPPPQKKKK